MSKLTIKPTIAERTALTATLVWKIDQRLFDEIDACMLILGRQISGIEKQGLGRVSCNSKQDGVTAIWRLRAKTEAGLNAVLALCEADDVQK